MPARKLYPGGTAQMNMIVPAPVKRAFERIAEEQRSSVSRIVVPVLEDYLLRRGYLREPEKVAI